MCRAMPFQLALWKKNIFFNFQTVWLKTNRNVVHRGLYSYRQRVRVVTLFPNNFFFLLLLHVEWVCNISLFQIDKPLNWMSTIIQFHLGQTPANLAAMSSHSKERIWTTRRGAPLVTLPKWTGRLEMTIATTAITASLTTPVVRP